MTASDLCISLPCISPHYMPNGLCCDIDRNQFIDTLYINILLYRKKNKHNLLIEVSSVGVTNPPFIAVALTPNFVQTR